MLFAWARDVASGVPARIVVQGPTGSGRTKAARLAVSLLLRAGLKRSEIAFLNGLDLDEGLPDTEDRWWTRDHRVVILDDADHWVPGLNYFGSDDPTLHAWCEARSRAVEMAMTDLSASRDKAVLVTVHDMASLANALGSHSAAKWDPYPRVSLSPWRSPAGVLVNTIDF